MKQSYGEILDNAFKLFGHCACLEKQAHWDWLESEQCEYIHQCQARKDIREYWVKNKNGPGVFVPLSKEIQDFTQNYIKAQFTKEEE